DLRNLHAHQRSDETETLAGHPCALSERGSRADLYSFHQLDSDGRMRCRGAVLPVLHTNAIGIRARYHSRYADDDVVAGLLLCNGEEVRGQIDNDRHYVL